MPDPVTPTAAPPVPAAVPTVPVVATVVPVAEPGRARTAPIVTVVVGAVVTAVLATGAGVGAVALLVAIAAVQAVVVVSWSLSAGVGTGGGEPFAPVPTGAVPGRIGSVLIAAAAAAGADVAVSVRPHSALSPLLLVVGLAVPAMFVHQLARGVVRTRVVESLSSLAVLVATVVAPGALMQLRHEFDGTAMTVAAALVPGAAVVVAGAVDLLWSRPRFDPQVAHGLSGVVVGIAAGIGTGILALRQLTQYGAPVAALLCAVVAVVATLLAVSAAMVARGAELAMADLGDAPRLVRAVAVAIVPLALVAPVSYLLLLVR